MALATAACGSAAPRTASHSAPATATPGSPSPAATATASPALTPGDFGTTPEGLTFQWAAGYTPPSWLPGFIARAPAAPSGGSTVCGPDPGTALFTALVRYDPRSPAGSITIQIQRFAGPGTYVNTAVASPVDVEVSPPAPDLTGLSGFGVPGATVHVNPDLVSGTVTSALQLGPRTVGVLTGDWRCN